MTAQNDYCQHYPKQTGKKTQTAESTFSLGKFSFCINSDAHQNMRAQINRKLVLSSLCFVPQFTIYSPL